MEREKLEMQDTEKKVSVESLKISSVCFISSLCVNGREKQSKKDKSTENFEGNWGHNCILMECTYSRISGF